MLVASGLRRAAILLLALVIPLSPADLSPHPRACLDWSGDALSVGSMTSTVYPLKMVKAIKPDEDVQCTAFCWLFVGFFSAEVAMLAGVVSQVDGLVFVYFPPLSSVFVGKKPFLPPP